MQVEEAVVQEDHELWETNVLVSFAVTLTQPREAGRELSPEGLKDYQYRDHQSAHVCGALS